MFYRKNKNLIYKVLFINKTFEKQGKYTDPNTLKKSGIRMVEK